jgi:hypothetical protein
MTIVLLLSALAIVRLFCCRIFFIWFRLCLCLLCSVLCVLVVMICLNFLVAKYLICVLYFRIQVSDGFFCVYYPFIDVVFWALFLMHNLMV